MSLRPFPRVMEEAARRASIIRGIAAMANTARTRSPGDAAAYAKSVWPSDRTAIEVATRAAVVPASTTGVTQFAHTSVSELISILGPQSGAAASIFARAMGLSFGHETALLVPNATAAATGVTFIAQSSPIPIRQLSLSGTTLTPMKIGLGFGLTREQAEGTNAEAYISAAFKENIALALDTLLFDNVAASTTRPAGLRNGLTPVSAASGGGLSALASDLGALADLWLASVAPTSAT